MNDFASQTPHARPWAIYSDFDGTLASHDTIDLLIEEFIGQEYERSVNLRLVSGELTVRGALEEEFARLHLSAAQIAQFLTARVRLDPALPALAEFARRRHIPLAILSSGMDLLIEPLLRAGGCGAVPLVCNRLRCEPANGSWNLSIEFRDNSANGHDKAAVLRQAKRDGRRIVYLGDGFTDLECAHEADVLFAKRRLARYCQERGIPYQPLASCSQVVEYLRRALGDAEPAAVGA